MNTLQSKFGDMFKCVHGLINETKSSDAHSHTSPGTQAYHLILRHHKIKDITHQFDKIDPKVFIIALDKDDIFRILITVVHTSRIFSRNNLWMCKTKFTNDKLTLVCKPNWLWLT